MSVNIIQSKYSLNILHELKIYLIVNNEAHAQTCYRNIEKAPYKSILLKVWSTET